MRRLRSAAAVVDGDNPRCARLEGFSLPVNVALSAHAREPLEDLCRYLLRPPLALERLTESSGQILYEIRHHPLFVNDRVRGAVQGQSTQPVQVRSREVSVHLGSYPGGGEGDRAVEALGTEIRLGRVSERTGRNAREA